MDADLDEAKGKAKEMAGTAADDPDLEREGKLDQAGADMKEKVGEAKDRANDLIDKGKDALSDRQ